MPEFGVKEKGNVEGFIRKEGNEFASGKEGFELCEEEEEEIGV